MARRGSLNEDGGAPGTSAPEDPRLRGKVACREEDRFPVVVESGKKQPEERLRVVLKKGGRKRPRRGVAWFGMRTTSSNTLEPPSSVSFSSEEEAKDLSLEEEATKSSEQDKTTMGVLHFVAEYLQGIGGFESTLRALKIDSRRHGSMQRVVGWDGRVHAARLEDMEWSFGSFRPRMAKIVNAMQEAAFREERSDKSQQLELVSDLIQTRESLRALTNSNVSVSSERVSSLEQRISTLTRTIITTYRPKRRVAVMHESDSDFSKKFHNSKFSGLRFLKKTQGHFAFVNCIALDPDCNYVCTGADDYLIKIWSARTGDLLRTLRGHKGRIVSLAATCRDLPTRDVLFASASADLTIRLWTAPGGRCVRILSGHRKPINELQFDHSNGMLYSCSSDGALCMWNAPAIHDAVCISGETPRSDSPAFSPVLHPHFDQVERGAPVEVCSLTVHPLGEMVATGSSDGLIRIWYTALVMDPELASRGQDFPGFAATIDGVFAIGNRRLVRAIKTKFSSVAALKWTTDGEHLVTSSGCDGIVQVFSWFTSDGTLESFFERPLQTVRLSSLQESLGPAHIMKRLQTDFPEDQTPKVDTLTLTSDGRYAITAQTRTPRDHENVYAFWDQQIRVWDLKRGGELVHILRRHRNQVLVLKAHPTFPNLVVSAGWDGLILLWDVVTGKLLSENLALHPNGIAFVLNAEFVQFGRTSADLLCTDSVGRLLILGVSDTRDFDAAPPAQYFINDKYAVNSDTFGNLVDSETNVAPHLLTGIPLCDGSLKPYACQPGSASRQARIAAVQTIESVLKMKESSSYSEFKTILDAQDARIKQHAAHKLKGGRDLQRSHSKRAQGESDRDSDQSSTEEEAGAVGRRMEEKASKKARIDESVPTDVERAWKELAQKMDRSWVRNDKRVPQLGEVVVYCVQAHQAVSERLAKARMSLSESQRTSLVPIYAPWQHASFKPTWSFVLCKVVSSEVRFPFSKGSLLKNGSLSIEQVHLDSLSIVITLRLQIIKVPPESATDDVGKTESWVAPVPAASSSAPALFDVTYPKPSSSDRSIFLPEKAFNAFARTDFERGAPSFDCFDRKVTIRNILWNPDKRWPNSPFLSVGVLPENEKEEVFLSPWELRPVSSKASAWKILPSPKISSKCSAEVADALVNTVQNNESARSLFNIKDRTEILSKVPLPISLRDICEFLRNSHYRSADEIFMDLHRFSGNTVIHDDRFSEDKASEMLRDLNRAVVNVLPKSSIPSNFDFNANELKIPSINSDLSPVFDLQSVGSRSVSGNSSSDSAATGKMSPTSSSNQIFHQPVPTVIPPPPPPPPPVPVAQPFPANSKNNSGKLWQPAMHMNAPWFPGMPMSGPPGMIPMVGPRGLPAMTEQQMRKNFEQFMAFHGPRIQLQQQKQQQPSLSSHNTRPTPAAVSAGSGPKYVYPRGLKRNPVAKSKKPARKNAKAKAATNSRRNKTQNQGPRSAFPDVGLNASGSLQYPENDGLLQDLGQGELQSLGSGPGRLAFGEVAEILNMGSFSEADSIGAANSFRGTKRKASQEQPISSGKAGSRTANASRKRSKKAEDPVLKDPLVHFDPASKKWYFHNSDGKREELGDHIDESSALIAMEQAKEQNAMFHSLDDIEEAAADADDMQDLIDDQGSLRLF